jgi:hypothetical protein
MALTRRNTLILLFTVIAAAGVIGGTGAFSTVNADRTVSVETSADSDANVQFVVNTEDYDSLTDGGSDDVIGLNFDNINLEANTTYNKALNVTVNSGAAGSYDISVSETPEDIDVEFTEGGGTSVTNVAPGNTQQLDVTISTIGDNTANTNEIDDSISFTVTRNGGV